MRRKVGLTMLEEHIESRSECRSAVDTKLVDFIFAAGFVPVLLPNNPVIVEHMLAHLDLTGIVFSGGGSCSFISNVITLRDEVEKLLLDWCLHEDKPCLGICRGMQFLVGQYGARFSNVTDHVATSHLIIEQEANERRIVNSYHEYGITHAPDFQVLAHASDGVIESVKHQSKKLYGIMWHPERYSNYEHSDINLIKSIFGEMN